MNNQIKALIKTSAEDLTKSTRDSVEQLLLQFDHAILYSVISDYMRDPSIGRKEWIICIHLLCRVDKIETNKRFVEALQVDDADKRFRIVKLLGGCGTEHIVPTLIKMLKDDPEPGIRFMVAATLGDIGDRRALPALEWSAEHDYGENHEGSTIAAEAKFAFEKITNM